MARVKIFIVFHKVLDERLSLHVFSPQELANWFVPYAVNENVSPKQYIDFQGHEKNFAEHPGLLEEYKLPHYDPNLQARGFMETSCYVHLLANHIYEKYDYIGVCQYDMRWTDRSAKILKNITKSESQYWRWLKKFQKPTIYCQLAAKNCWDGSRLHPMASASKFDWQYLVKSYNTYFRTSFRLEDIQNAKLSLWQTYVLPRDYFVELAGWLRQLCDEIYPWANQAPYETHWGVMGGFTERAEALFMALRERSGEIRLRKLYLEHDETIPEKLGIAKNHYLRSEEKNA